MPETRYKAFISYSHDDEQWANWLHRALEKYRLPRRIVRELGRDSRQLGTFFRDQEELAASPVLKDTIRDALSNSENLIVICSRYAATSPWVDREVQYFVETGRRSKIFCLIVDGVPNDPRRECLPPALRSEHGAEPLGADVHADGKSHSLDRLAAGLLGSDYGTFTQRLHRHRQKRLVGLSSAALAGLAVTATLAALAYLGQQQAKQESARATAVRQFMEDVMLAPDPFGGEGKNVTVIDALDRSVSEVYRVFRDQPDSQAAALHSIGTVYRNLGRYTEAEPLAERALELRTATYGPDHKEVAQSHDLLGTIYRDLSKFDDSERHYQRAIAVREQELGRTSIPAIRSTLNLINLYVNAGRYDDARTLSITLDGEQIRADDETTYLLYRDSLGTLEWSLGNYDDAARHYESFLSVTKAVFGDKHPFVGKAQNNLAVVYENTGRVEDAKLLLRDSLQIYTDALGKDHQDVAAANLNLAVLLDAHGELDAAKIHYQEALRIDRLQFGEKSFQAATTMINFGPVLCADEKNETGLDMVIQAQQTFEELLEPAHWRIGNAHRWRADCLKSLGRYAEAEQHLNSALEITIDSLGDDNYRTEKIRDAIAALETIQNAARASQ